MTRQQYTKKGQDMLVDANGNQVYVSGTYVDGIGPGYNIATIGQQYSYNGSSWDRIRNNMQGTLLASAARTANTTCPNQTNFNAKGIKLFLNITAASGTGGLTLQVSSVDPVSGLAFVEFRASTAQTGTGYFGFEIYPGANTAGTNATGWIAQRVAAAISRQFNVTVLHGDNSNYTYSVGYSLIN